MPRPAKQKVIAHCRDGVLLKGTTTDFSSTKSEFTVTTEGGARKVKVGDLKALFFVKEFKGRPEYRERKGFFDESGGGRKVLVEFVDGEVLFGYADSYSEAGAGFFMVPGDPDSNNIKVYVVRAATKRIKLKGPDRAKKVHAGTTPGSE
ncbi:MAG: hypothetical protein ACE5EO_07625 [Candidatus Krumholzibacteriia bacterium]